MTNSENLHFLTLPHQSWTEQPLTMRRLLGVQSTEKANPDYFNCPLTQSRV